MQIHTKNRCAGLFCPLVGTLFFLFFSCDYAIAQEETPLHIIVTPDESHFGFPHTDFQKRTVILDPEKNQFQAAEDALRAFPEIEIQRSGEAGHATLRIHGAGPEGTLLIVDGVPWNDVSSVNGQGDIAALAFEDIARIEVIPRPSGVRYGSRAMAGVVHIETRRPKKPHEAHLGVTVGSYGTFHETARYGQKFERGAMSLTVARTDRKGFSIAREELGNTEPDGVHGTMASGRASYNLSDRSTFEWSARWSRTDADLDGTPTVSQRADDALFTSRTDFFSTALKGFFRSEDWDQNLLIHFSETNRSYWNAPDWIDPSVRTDMKYRGQVLEFEWDHKFIFFEDVTSHSGFQLSYTRALFSQVSPISSDDTGGGVWTRLEKPWRYESGVWRTTAGSRLHLVSSGYQMVWEVGTAWEPEPLPVRVWGVIATGFRRPTLFELKDPVTGNRLLESERSQAFQIGGSHHISAFIIEQKLFMHVFNQRIHFDGTRLSNSGSVLSRGAMSSVLWRAHTYLTFSAGYSYTDMYDRNSRLSMIRVSPHSAQLELRFKPHNLHGLSMYSQVQWRSSRPDIDPVTFSRATTPGYELLHFGIEKKWKHVSVHGRIDNLFDRSYEEIKGYGTPARSFYVGCDVRL